MATRSFIGLLNDDNTVDYIYCHWDGYPEHNGVILMENYTDVDYIRDLLSFGDLSSLGPMISAPEGVKHSYHNKVKDVCVFYGRDRGEKGTESRKTTLDEYFSKEFQGEWIEFKYLFDPKIGWRMADNKGLKDFVRCWLNKENIFLQAELNELQELLRAIPESNIIERMSLESRLDSVRKKLLSSI